MLHIHSIRVFEDCDENLRKNLQTDKPFVFKKMEFEDFFAKNISIYALVGKNGSGKSSLLELMFRMVNNLSYVLLHDIQRDGAYPLRYVYGIYANLDYEVDKNSYRLSCLDKRVTLMTRTMTVNWKVIIDATIEVPHVRLNRVIYPKNNKCEIDIDQFRELSEKLFYTVAVNYSLQAYVEQDFKDEKTEWHHLNSGRAISTHRAEDAWINGLFHKNDGYMCPIVLNPYRDKGKIDMNREMKLTQQRLEALLIYYKLIGIDYIDGYTLNTVKYTFDPEVINGYFSNKVLLRLLQIQTNKETKEIEKDLVDKGKKFKLLKELFIQVLEAKELNFQQQILTTFGIKYQSNRDEDLIAAELYLICKIINIAEKYPTYEKQKKSILLEDNENFDYLEILNPYPYTEYIKPMKALAMKVKKQSGHIGLKAHRAIRYILQSQKESRLSKRKIALGNEFELSDYEKYYWKDEQLNSVERISKVLPPSIFSYEIMLEKTVNRYDDDAESVEKGSIIPMRQMSSGERQFLFTTSTIAYHLQNLRSVKSPSPCYNHFHIILDEVEICFHPEYQRTFVHKLLSLLTRLGMNDNKSISIWIATHSPFILSDIPMNNILYLKKGHQRIATEVDNPFGANINDILKQSFFLNHGFMGEFSKYYVMSLCHYLYPMDNEYQNIPSLYRNIAWDAKKAYYFIQQVGEPLLHTQLMAAYQNSPVLSKQQKRDALIKALNELDYEENSRN